MKLHEFTLISSNSESCYDIFKEALKSVQQLADRKKWSERYCLVYQGYTDGEDKRTHQYELHTVDYLASKGRIY